MSLVYTNHMDGNLNYLFALQLRSGAITREILMEFAATKDRNSIARRIVKKITHSEGLTESESKLIVSALDATTAPNANTSLVVAKFVEVLDQNPSFLAAAIASSVINAISSASVTEDSAPLLADPSSPPSSEASLGYGAILGAIAGGLLAGPPGVVAGAYLGAVAGAVVGAVDHTTPTKT
jgi:hypothetical protein